METPQAAVPPLPYEWGYSGCRASSWWSACYSNKAIRLKDIDLLPHKDPVFTSVYLRHSLMYIIRTRCSGSLAVVVSVLLIISCIDWMVLDYLVSENTAFSAVMVMVLLILTLILVPLYISTCSCA